MKNLKVFTTEISKNKSNGEREENDYYATNPKTVKALLEVETFDHNIWEPACGEGHISEVLKSYGYDVFSTDLINRGYGQMTFDFMLAEKGFTGDIITNPPYKYAQEFVEKALYVVEDGCKVAMLLKIRFLEGKKRRSLFDKNPPQKIYVFCERQECGKNGVFTGKSAFCYAWFIWIKGHLGPTYIKWI